MGDKTLIVGPSWVGDMVMAQTLFMCLKQHSLDNELVVMAPQWTRTLTQAMPEVSGSIDLPFAHGDIALRARYRLGKALRSEQFSHAIVLPNSFKSALIPYWAQIPHRTGWRGEMRYGVLNDLRVLKPTQYPLMIQRFAALAFPKQSVLPDKLPIPRLRLIPHKANKVLETFSLTPTRPILALCPGAEFGSSKRWPVEYFAQLANEYLSLGWGLWLLGSKNDQHETHQINRLTGNRCDDLAGKTTLAQAMALLSFSTVVVTNDSGLMHISAALQKPVVVIYGSTSPTFTPPLGQKVKVIQKDIECSPCFERECPLGHHRCMKSLSAHSIIQAVSDLS